MQDYVTIIQSVGFPIFCVLAMGFAMYKFANRIMQENKEREEKYVNMLNKYSEQMDKLEQANADFIVVIGKLRDDVNEIKEVLKDGKDNL